jgi:hypothetical protein
MVPVSFVHAFSHNPEAALTTACSQVVPACLISGVSWLIAFV